MRLQVSFKQLEHTKALDQAIEEKSRRLEKYFTGQTQMIWTCSANKGQHLAELKMIGPNFEFMAKAKSENLYLSLDLAIDKIEKQIEKKKDKWKNQLHRNTKNFIDFHEAPEAVFADCDEDKFDDVA